MRPDHTALKLGNIYWLLAAMAFVIAPHADRLPLWFTALCALVAAWRGFIAWRGLKAPRGWMMALLAAGATAATFFSAVAFATPRMANRRDAGISMCLARSLISRACTPALSVSTSSMGVARLTRCI